jgi:hypothetical protein
MIPTFPSSFILGSLFRFSIIPSLLSKINSQKNRPFLYFVLD